MSTKRSAAASAPARTSRRSPSPEVRKRDAERTRALILDAAVAEFARAGYAGARIAAIADRAGVNKQLISYYFGGKEGLYQAVVDQWRLQDINLDDTPRSLPDVIAHYVHAATEHRDFARLLAWQGLTMDQGGFPPDAYQAPRMAESVAWLRRCQEAGELAPDLDPACVLLAFFAAASVGAVLPQVVKSITGLDPAAEEFVSHYAEQLERMTRHLAADQSDSEGRSP